MPAPKLSLTLAQVAFAFAKLTGGKLRSEKQFGYGLSRSGVSLAADWLFVTFGRAALESVVAEYDADVYLSGGYDL